MIMISPFSIAAAHSTESKSDHLNAAAEAIRQGRYSEAIREYQMVLNGLSRQPEILSNLGLAYYLNGNYQEAVAAFKNALQEEPNLIAANLFLGISYLKLSEPNSAIPLLRKALLLEPQNADARLALGTAYLARGQYVQGIEELEIARRARPGNSETCYQLGKAYLKLGDEAANHLRELDANITSSWARLLVAEVSLGQGRYVSAEHDLQAIAVEEPLLPGVHGMLGTLYLEEGRTSEAEEQFKNELERYPRSLDALYGLMQVALAEGNYKGALELVERMLNFQPAYLAYKAAFPIAFLLQEKALRLIRQIGDSPSNQAASNFLEGLLYAQAGNLDTAKARFQTFSTLALRPDANKATPSEESLSLCTGGNSKQGPDARSRLADHLLRAICLFQMGLYAKSLHEVNAVLTDEPQNLEALYWQARICKELAVSAFHELEAIDPNSFRVHQLLGQIYATKFQLDEGVQEYRKAILLNPNLSSVNLELGMLYRDHARYDWAISEVQRALELSPNDLENSYVLGDIYLKAGQPTKAIPYLERVIAKDTSYVKARLDLGKAYRAEGRFEEALRELKAALPLDRSGEIHYQLSQLYRKTGRPEEAHKEMIVSQRIRTERTVAARKRGVYAVLAGPN